MLRLSEVSEAVHNLLFGDITISETQNTFSVECIHKDDYFHIKGRFLIEKKDNKIDFAYINILEFVDSDRIYPVKEVTKLGRVNDDAIDNVLESFEDCQLNFGYSSFIKLKGLKENGNQCI